MTGAEWQHVQRLFEAYRRENGPHWMIHIRFDEAWRLGIDMDAFADFCAKQKGAKSGTLRQEAIEEIRTARKD